MNAKRRAAQPLSSSQLSLFEEEPNGPPVRVREVRQEEAVRDAGVQGSVVPPVLRGVHSRETEVQAGVPGDREERSIVSVELRQRRADYQAQTVRDSIAVRLEYEWEADEWWIEFWCGRIASFQEAIAEIDGQLATLEGVNE